MKRKILSITFFIKKLKPLKNGDVRIYMRITFNGVRSEAAIDRTIHPERWNGARGAAKSNSEDGRILNNYLELQKRRVEEIQEELERKKKRVTAKTLKNVYIGNDNDDERTVLKVYDEHNAKLKLRIGKDVKRLTYVRHVTTRNHLERFINQKYSLLDFYLKDVDPEFFDSLHSYFLVDRDCNNNTSVKYIRNFAKIIRLAMRNEWIQGNPMRNLNHKMEPVDKPFLNQNELDAIQSFQTNIERIAQVRDIFLFCCYTGLAYVDTHALTSKNLEFDREGTDWIRIRRSKTGKAANIPLLPSAKEIITKYENNPVCRVKGVLLPVLSNQKMNAYLKEVADLCGIEKNLTTHCARHTFATTVTLANNVPIEVVSKMLGHSDLRMTQQYARILDQTVGTEMDKLAQKMSPKKSKKKKHKKK